MAEVRRVGMLTGGGDAPGLNGVIRAVTTKCDNDYGYEVHGLKRGWKALLDPEEDTVMPLTADGVRYILQEGGTILGSSRTNPYKNEGDAEKVVKQMEDFGIDALVAIGGDDTLGVAKRLYDDFGVQVVGCPKTIDNDLSATDTTFGYDTAVSIATDAIDKLRTTAKSHERVVVVEVMGRHAGWITWGAGLASAANVTLIPEVEPDLDRIADIFKERAETGREVGPRRRLRGRDVLVGVHDPEHRDGRVRPREARRHRREAGGRDQGAHGHRDPPRGPRTPPARRHPHRLRPYPRAPATA